MSDIAAILVTLGPKLAQHVLLAGSALALGIIVALPLAVWASRSASVARVALTFASLVQTIPALALLALFFPLLLSLRDLRRRTADAGLPSGPTGARPLCPPADLAERGYGP